MSDGPKDPFEFVRFVIDERRAGVIDLVEHALNTPHMTAEDLDVLRDAKDEFAGGMLRIMQRIERISQSDKDLAFNLLVDLHDLTRGLLFCVSRAATSDSARNLHRAQQAGLARAKRQDKPSELALRVAVQEVWNGISEAGRKKRGVASSILDRVNKRLAEAGHQKVKVDAVRRRLPKTSS